MKAGAKGGRLMSDSVEKNPERVLLDAVREAAMRAGRVEALTECCVAAAKAGHNALARDIKARVDGELALAKVALAALGAVELGGAGVAGSVPR